MHPSNPVVAEYGCWAVVVLGNSTVNKETLGLAGACAATYQACKAHPLNDKVSDRFDWVLLIFDTRPISRLTGPYKYLFHH